MGFKLCTKWVETSTNAPPTVSITRRGVMLWNKRLNDVFSTSEQGAFRLYHDERQQLLGVSLCKKATYESVPVVLSEKMGHVNTKIVKLFTRLGLNWENYVGQYTAIPYEDEINKEHEITFYIDLKQHQEQV